MTKPSEQRWEARLFAVGSICFAVAAVPGFASLVGATADNATYFIGSICFTTASFTQWMLTGRRKGRAWRSPAWSDWWSAAIQFPGTLFFNVSTFSALVGGSDVWRPDALGSACFLVSSIMAMRATVVRDQILWDPTSRTWETAWLNLIGSVAFGVSAIAAYTVPSSGEVVNVALVNLGTFVGALCFLGGALLMTPDPARVPAPAAGGSAA